MRDFLGFFMLRVEAVPRVNLSSGCLHSCRRVCAADSCAATLDFRNARAGHPTDYVCDESEMPN